MTKGEGSVLRGSGHPDRPPSWVPAGKARRGVGRAGEPGAGRDLCPHLQGYRQKDYFIATQGPLAHTVEDFWRMVWEWKCHTIVMLTEVQEREQVRAARPSPGALCV